MCAGGLDFRAEAKTFPEATTQEKKTASDHWIVKHAAMFMYVLTSRDVLFWLI